MSLWRKLMKFYRKAKKVGYNMINSVYHLWYDCLLFICVYFCDVCLSRLEHALTKGNIHVLSTFCVGNLCDESWTTFPINILLWVYNIGCVVQPLIEISVLKIDHLSSTVGSTENSSIVPMNFHWKGEVHWLQEQENFLSVHSALPMRRDGWGGVHWSGEALKTAGNVTDLKAMAIICTVYLLRDKL